MVGVTVSPGTSAQIVVFVLVVDDVRKWKGDLCYKRTDTLKENCYNTCLSHSLSTLMNYFSIGQEGEYYDY